MNELIQLIETYGLVVVFITVFLDQGGLPIPSYPPMIVAAAIATNTGGSAVPILVVGTAAALTADWLWFHGGRRLGARLLRLLCILSLSPDSCVAQARGIYSRYGAPSLVVSKFIPGFAAVGTTLAGETGLSVPRFLLFDGLGALLWTGIAVGIGVMFHSAVNEVLDQLAEFGRYGLMVFFGLIAAYIAFKWWQRRSFMIQIQMARITSAELRSLIDDGAAPVILDVRSLDQRLESGWIPGAIFVANVADPNLSPQENVVIYCDCPNEASAALLARSLKSRGFQNVRPLAGGFKTWQAEGNPTIHSSTED